MALSPSLAPRPAAEASRPETARTVNGAGADAAEGTGGAEGAAGERRATAGAGTAASGGAAGTPGGQQAGASVPGPAQ
ncbi:hypothetical protein, partial [Kitasatospora sp. NPDC047058]|uniref:hypothetical protein n=1 Tax=Kitasatospora sp. NPDC047058 TaxID=3155620 RepID=UPI0033FBB93D